jgi:hypothetical protein
MNKDKNGVERRIDARYAYSGDIFFATKDRFFEGELINYSEQGLFIKTCESLTLGAFITVALPSVCGQRSKVQAQILWRNHEGYGVELVKERNGKNTKLLRLEARSMEMNHVPYPSRHNTV